MRTLQNVIVGGLHKTFIQNALALPLVENEKLKKHRHVRDLEVVVGVLHLPLQVHVAVADLAHPLQVVNVFHLLNVHGQALDAVGDLRRHKFHVDAAHLLEIGELRHLHPIEPNLPA